MSALIDKLLRVIGFKFARPTEPAEKPWLVDRDGRVILPSRRVVLKGKPQ